ncbi:hypothetical protein MTO96_047585 [Rhipicephalus appendiculatus]
MVAVWSHSMDKRPGDRTEDDLESIYGRLRSIKAFHRLHPVLLQQLCFYGYYEDLDRGVTLFRQGDRGSNWYTVLAGSLDVQVTHTGHSKIADERARAADSQRLCGRPDTLYAPSTLLSSAPCARREGVLASLPGRICGQPRVDEGRQAGQNQWTLSPRPSGNVDAYCKATARRLHVALIAGYS